MKNIFNFKKNLDVSDRNNKFYNLENYSLRNFIRDFYDKIFRRPFYKFYYYNFFKSQDYKIDLTIPAKGLSTLERRNKLNLIKTIKNKSILNIGCGNAFDYHFWFRFKPKKIVGVDVLNYKKSWKQVYQYVQEKKINTKVEFFKKDIINFNYKKQFDFIVSDAVYEHCKNFDHVIKKCKNLLKKNGILYASYGGPMWFTYAGDHFSGRDKIENGFNHLLLNQKDYYKYFKKNVRSLEYELDKGGGGGVLVQENLFSKLMPNEYIDIFKKYGFELIKIYVEFCPIGYKLIKGNNDLKKKLQKKFPNIDEENFYLKTHIAYFKNK